MTGSGPPSGISDLAFTPDGTRAVAAFSFEGGVQGLSVSAAGALAPVGEPTATGHAQGVAVSPDGRFAYLPTTGTDGIRAFAIAADGSLTSLGSGVGSGYGDIAITPDGRHLFAATSSTEKLERFAIAADGTLTSLGTKATPLPPSRLAVSPDGRYLFAAITNGHSEEGVASYAIGADGSLEEAGEPVLYTEDSLYYLAVSPDGAHLYVADGNHGVIALAVGADGSLTDLGTTPAEEVKAVAVSPDGRFLYYHYDDSISGQGIRVAALGADGVPAPLSFFSAWDAGSQEERIVFGPEPTPVAAFSAAPGAPGAATSFDASASARAVRYDWDFGDGTVLEDGGPTPSHVYASPGTYTATLKVTDANGCSSEQIYTGQSTECPGGAQAVAANAVQVALPATPPPPNSPPSLGPLRVVPRAFAVDGNKGKSKHSRHLKHSTTFRYQLSEPAQVTFTIRRKVLGRKVGGKCKHRTRGNDGRKPCVLRYRLEGPAFSRAGKQGANSDRFDGKVPRASGKGKRTLKPGAYRVTAVATDADGARSQTRSADFKIVAG